VQRDSSDCFTPQEIEELDLLLAVGINPFLHGNSFKGERTDVALGGKTKSWLFETKINLPSTLRRELDELGFDTLSDEQKLAILNDILEEREVSSAPKWWELNFFSTNWADLWKFFLERSIANYGDTYNGEILRELSRKHTELVEAMHILEVSKHNKGRYKSNEIEAALTIVDESYPFDLHDQYEVPRRDRTPLGQIQELIALELDNLDTVFSKRWFEFKIFDELTSFLAYHYNSKRESELAQKVAAQLKFFMYGEME